MADADVLVIGTGPKLRTASLLSGRPVPPFISSRMPPHTCKSHNSRQPRRGAVRPRYRGGMTRVTGPRTWWDGPLDVEGLALQAVAAVADALGALTGKPDRYAVSAPATFAAFNSLGHLRVDGRSPRGFAPLSGFWPTRDGWIRTHGNYPHHRQRLLSALRLDPGLSDDDAVGQLSAVLHELPGDGAERAIQAVGGIAARVRTPDEWAGTAMAHAVADEPWIRVEPSSGAGRSWQTRSSAWAPAGDVLRPLTGLRVLDFTRVIAGPVATRVLGALGAEVLRIDPPSLPELMDHHIDAGFDKRSALADLSEPAVLARVRELMAEADVVVSGYRPGAMARFGLDAATLVAEHPHLAVAELDAWGPAGPWGGMRGFDSIVQAASGIATIYGSGAGERWRPGALPCQALDHATGYGIAAGLIRLLAERRESGCGGRVHMSLARTAVELMGLPVPEVTGGPAAKSGATSSPEPALRSKTSDFGVLEYVPLPLTIDGELLDYRRPPMLPGSAELAWR